MPDEARSWWRQRIDGHAAVTRVSELRQTIEALSKEKFAKDHVADVDHLWRVCVEAEARLRESDPQLVTDTMLAALDGAVANLVNVTNAQRTNTQQTGTPFEWTSLPSDQVLDVLVTWPSLPQDESVRAAVEVADRLPTEVAGVLDDVRAKSTAALEALQASQEQIRTTGEQAVAQVTAKTNDLEARISEQVEMIGQQLARIEGALGSYETQFSQAQSQRDQQFAEALKTARDGLDAALKDGKEQAAAERRTFTEQAAEALRQAEANSQSLLSQLEARREEAAKIVGVIARTGMSGGYQQHADRERGDADRWRKVAVVLGVLAVIVLAVVVYASGVEHHPSAAVVGGRIALSAALGGVATYAARQSAQHRTRAERARNLELALASIGPYVEALPDEKRREVLEAFAFVFFTPTAVPAESDPNKESIGPTALQAASELLTRVRGGPTA